ncbi:MAG: class I SAM-dependent rRNA methyltransferase [Pirellulales bacterium]|nr:class I SAM-dependent rRNA methyltransferase [Pirellulales bacterium]
MTAPARFPTARVILKPRKSKPFFGRHPWVLDSAIDRVEGEPVDGDAVELFSEKEKWIAHGVYNSRSRLRVRLYTWKPSEFLDQDFWRARIQQAIDLRASLGLIGSDQGTRLVFSEGDGLSGLIVDRYGDYLSIMVTGQAFAIRLPQVVEILVDSLRPRGVFVRTEKGVAQTEGISLADGLYSGVEPAGPIFITENGIRYGVDLRTGQKTGFYLDQRDNRAAVTRYLRGRRVLDMFCYSGGFALNALKHGGAREVLAIDGSERAIALAGANAQLNAIAGARFEKADGFECLSELVVTRQRFGAVILDPPKFARSRQSVADALRAYHRLNRLGVDVLEPGGILVTCSCSGHVTREDLLHMLGGVSQQTGRDIQVLEQRGAAPDHPVAASCLETEYLKCLICRVL